ncbi:hypothetical protein CEXT_813461 [Caerostris extrusa]|uniref:Uncharacterized protein n=1 Tax=Caerostris extrusa TaxID=172846 RepID=A0AAV4U0K6_CAEEX|nr:hypothetical protein CEXT_813461 [Caerostris extrusa]
MIVAKQSTAVQLWSLRDSNTCSMHSLKRCFTKFSKEFRPNNSLLPVTLEIPCHINSGTVKSISSRIVSLAVAPKIPTDTQNTLLHRFRSYSRFTAHQMSDKYQLSKSFGNTASHDSSAVASPTSGRKN